jgi:hypothetical protein
VNTVKKTKPIKSNKKIQPIKKKKWPVCKKVIFQLYII